MTPTRNRTRHLAGFTLTEMLVTMLIMVLASTLLATGIPVAVDTYQKTVNSANAQVAMSTAITVLRSEYGLSPKIKVVSSGTDQEVYYMTEEGLWATIRNHKAGEEHRGLVKEYVQTAADGGPDLSKEPLGAYPIVPDAVLKGANKTLAMTVGSISGETGAVAITELVVSDGTNQLAYIDSYKVAARFAS